MNTKKTVLTGDRPTGALHLGHYVGSLQNRVKLQDGVGYLYDSAYYMVADVQALTDNYDNPQKVHDNVIQVLADNMAVGVDPEKTTMFIQSQIPQIAELTVFFMNLVTANQMMHNPTIKTEIKQKNFRLLKSEQEILTEIDNISSLNLIEEGSYDKLGKKEYNDKLELIKEDIILNYAVPMGFLNYPVSQAADILFAKASVIPVGEDQKPVVEVCRDIARKFNSLYKCDIFPEAEVLISETPRLIGSDGNAKMSKSLGNAIYLGDQPDVIEKKIKGMFTCPSKVRVTDTVTDEELSKNVVFQYLDIFDTSASSKQEIAELKEKYKSGDRATGDSVVKARLNDVLQNMLAPIRSRREELLKDPAAIMEIARKGSEKAKLIGEQTMREVRAAMKIGYFD